MSAPSPATFLLESSASGNLPLLLAAMAGAMYWLGGARFRAACRAGTIAMARRKLERRRTFSFICGLAILVLALQQPMDSLAGRYFWAHMSQHVLLLVVVPPLMMLAAPWMRLWRGFPLSFRRSFARWVVGSRSAAPLRSLAHLLGTAWVAFTLMSLDLIAWHIPAAYDQTLRSIPVHYLEHATFLFFGLLAWGQVIDSPPFHSRLSDPQRAAFATGQMVVGWVLAILLAFSSQPWYSVYAAVRQREGGLSALADQHLAAGVMWVPASLPWSLLIFVLIYHWLAEGEDERGPVAVRAPVPAPVPPADPRPAETVTIAGESERSLRTERRIHAARTAAHR